MRILMVHNHYQQAGGEDQVFDAESRVLEQQGHRVIRLHRQYSDLVDMTRAMIARRSVWNGDTFREVRDTIRKEHVQVAHFHNTFPLVSPSAYYAAQAEHVPVVQTLHNYRLLCPGAVFFREGRVCEDCLGHAVPWRAVQHACYRGSRAQSAALVGMLAVHRLIGTWQNAVTLYVALTEFARGKFIEGGLPQEKIHVKPNFMAADPGAGDGKGAFALFVGRFTRDKGVEVLLNAWRASNPRLPLRIVGDGPLRESVMRRAELTPNVEVLGSQSRTNVLRLMKAAAVLIVPSLWYEGFPMTVVEAFACGLPVIASNLGSLSSVVRDKRTGHLFRPGDAAGLAACVERFGSNPGETSAMRRNARAVFEERYDPQTGYKALIEVYDKALRRN
jgi:glycosyltransferase involved in cell wall biosynthesis